MLTPSTFNFHAFSALDCVIALREHRNSATISAALYALLTHCPHLPLPARGDTASRWRTLQHVGALDLTLVKLAEPHWDALAILDECVEGGAESIARALCHQSDERGRSAGHELLNRNEPNRTGDLADGPQSAVWAVWAAEPPTARLCGTEMSLPCDSRLKTVRLNGVKAWCSGADFATHALVTYWNDADQACLAAVNVGNQAIGGPISGNGMAARAQANETAWGQGESAYPGVSVTRSGWHAVGMDASASWDVAFNNVHALAIGEQDVYLSRPGFWHGGIGIAACWAGGALAVANRVACSVHRADPHALAHLGAIDVALSQLMTLMRDAAQWVDAHPADDARGLATRVRCAAEQCATTVLYHAGRALGAGPLCKDAPIARLFADLPVFIRQSHAERDLAALGETVRGSAQDENNNAPIGSSRGAPLWTI